MASRSRDSLSRQEVEIEDMSSPVERLAMDFERDEPTAALGVRETSKVIDLTLRLRDTVHTVVLISHNMADVVAVATRVAILKAGRKVIGEKRGHLLAVQLTSLIMAEAGQISP